MVAQTMVRQRVSVVNTSIWKVTLSHVAKQAFDGIRRLNIAMHGLRELIKREGLLFFLSQASHSLWIALAVLGFEGGQFCQCLLFTGLIPDANEFGLQLAPLASGKAFKTLRCLFEPPALAGCGRKQLRDRGQQSVMALGDDQLNAGWSS